MPVELKYHKKRDEQEEDVDSLYAGYSDAKYHSVRVDVDTSNHNKTYLKEPRQQNYEKTEEAEEPTGNLWDRTVNFFKTRRGEASLGAAQQWLADEANSLTGLYASGEGGRTQRSNELLNDWQNQLATQQQYLDAALQQLNQNPNDAELQVFVENLQRNVDDLTRNINGMNAAQGADAGSVSAAYSASGVLANKGQQHIENAKTGLGKVGRTLVDVGAQTTQMALDEAASRALGLGIVGKGPVSDAIGFAPFVARSIGGGAKEAYDNGASGGQALAYGAAQGAKEYITEKLFGIATPFKFMQNGSLDNFVSGTIERAVSKLPEGVAQSIAKGMMTGAASFSSEFLEELIGNVIEYGTQMKRIYGGDPGTLGEAITSGAEEGLTAGLSALLGAPLGGVMDARSRNQEAMATYGSDPSGLVADTAAMVPDSRTVQNAQTRLDAGKNLSGGTLSRLADLNERATISSDVDTITASVRNRLSELGETGDIDAISSAIARTVSGNALGTEESIANLGFITPSERRTIQESKYGQRVLNELDPNNILSQTYDTNWAENIGTKRINTTAYTLMGQAKNAAETERKKAQPIAPRQGDLEYEQTSEPTLTGNDTVDSVVRKAFSTELSQNDVRPILGDTEAMTALENAVGTIDLKGKSSSEQRAAVREAVARYAEMNRPAETVTMTKVPTDIAAIAKQYGKQESAVRSIYNIAPTSDTQSFAKAFDALYQIGLEGGSEDAAMNLELAQSLSETQRSLAYATGVDARKAGAPVELGDNGGYGRRGVVRAYGMTAKELNRRFKHGSNQKDAVSVLRAISEATGFTIELFDSSGDYTRENGSYDRGSDIISIDINSGVNSINDVESLAKYTMLRTFSHEITHAGEKWAASEYNTLRAAVMEALSSNSDYNLDDRIQKVMNEQGLSWDMASREIVADAMTDVLPESKFMENLIKKDPSLAQKLVGAFKDFITKIQSYFKNIVSNPSREAQALKVEIDGTVRYMKGIVEKWDAMVEAASENYKQAVAEQRRAQEEYEAKPEKATAADINRKGIESVVDQNGKKMFQLRTMKQDLDGYMEDLRNAGLVGEGKAMSERELTDLYTSINTVMGYVENHLEDIERSESFRNMDGTNRPFLPYKENSDPHYKMALDYSTLCRKRLLTQAITERLQAALGRAIKPVEQVKIRNEIKKLQADGKKIDVACALCYVEAARLKSPKVMNEFLDNRSDSLKNYFSLKNSKFKTDVYEKRRGDWKEARGLPRNATKDQIAAAGYSVSEFNRFSVDIRKGYWEWLEKAQPDMFRKQSEIISTAESMDASEFLSAASLSKLRLNMPELYDAFISKVRSATRSKAQETDVPYKRGDIDRVGQALIDQMNEESGFRHQSWSDFQAMHLLDTVAAVIELATRNAKVHTYTKVSDMVRFLGMTNMAINMSLIPAGETGLKADGTLDFDPVEGINFDDMVNLRDEFHATAGNIAIGITDDQIRAMMASTYIDYIIPYHTSGLNADMRKRMGIRAWKDYTKWQNESGGTGPGLSEWFNEQEGISAPDGFAYMVKASKQYLQLCHERGVTPKFPQFLVKNNDGSYSLSPDAQNYWKLLIDRKMVDQITRSVIIQKPVIPKFDTDTMLDILSKEVDSEAVRDAREAEDNIVKMLLSGDVVFTKQELAQARAIRDAAVRQAIENTAKETRAAKVGEEYADTLSWRTETESSGIEASEDRQKQYEIRYPQYTEEEIKKNSVELQRMKPVVEISGTEIDSTEGKLDDRILTLFAKWGYNIFSEQFGDVSVRKSSVHSERRHGVTTEKIQAYPAIPDVIKNGVVIDSMQKERGGPERIVVAAPIIMGKQKYYMGVMLQRDAHNQRLYAHDVVIEKEPTEFSGDILSTTGSRKKSELHITDILLNALNVKQDFSQNQYSVRDSEYMAAVESGDMETAQRMVDEAARAAGYRVEYMYRGGGSNHNVLLRADQIEDFDSEYAVPGNLGYGIYFTPNREYAERFGNVQKFYLKYNNAADITNDPTAKKTLSDIENEFYWDMEEDDPNYGLYDAGDVFYELASRLGTDAIKGTGVSGLSYGASEIAVQESWQAKLADPVTYDDNGNVIPLSERFNSDNPDIRYSRRMDSDGNELSEQQAEYFEDSKVRDADGNLLVMYHGTDADFTVFDRAFIGSKGRFEGAGFNFTPSESRASGYSGKGTILSGYLNITNPLSAEKKTLTVAKLAKIIREIDPTGDNIISNYAQETRDYGKQSFIDRESRVAARNIWNFSDNDVDIYSEISSADPDSDSLIEKFKSSGYDGLIHYNDSGSIKTCIAFDSNQFKNADNLTPTTNPDIRYQRRQQSYTDREVLELASDVVDSRKLTDGERAALDIFNKRLGVLKDLQEQRDDQRRILEDQKSNGASAEEIQKTKNRLSIIGRKLKAAENAVLTVQDKQVLKKVLHEARRVVEREQRQIVESRDTRKKHIARIKETTLKLSAWLQKNSDKEHVPEVLKKPLTEFLNTLDFSSTRLLNGGEMTKEDRKFAENLVKINSLISGQQDAIEGRDGAIDNVGAYLDISPENREFLNDLVNLMAMNSSGSFTLNEMNVEQLKSLDRFMRNLSAAISKANRALANARYQNIPEMANESMRHFDAMGKARAADGTKLSKFLKWTNTTPYYAFKRFGEAGKSLFDGLSRGWEQLAKNAREIIDFTEKTYKPSEVRAWQKEIHNITLEDGSKIQMTTAQLMALSQLFQRPQAMQHISAGGIRIGTIKQKRGSINDTKHYHLSIKDMAMLNDLLTDRQKEVAQKLRSWMGQRGEEWGNEISMARFGYEFYTEGEGYYPIKTDDNVRPMKDTDDPQNASMFRLLNLSFSKALNPHASNALVVEDIFDTFADHMSDMAKLNALGLPLLDAIKWYNYTERDNIDNAGQYSVTGLKASMEEAFGKAAGSYFKQLLKDVNGAKEARDRGNYDLTSNYKVAAVAANLRVAFLQPTSYIRAMAVLNPKYMLSAFTSKNAYKEALQYSGTAVWKSLGYYDTDISRSLRSQIENDDTWLDKIKEGSMKLAEIGDQRTWGRLWVACKMQTKAENPELTGEALKQKTADLFRETIYATQVMDSTLTRSEIMRSTTKWDKLKTAFMSEPTLSLNLIMDSFSQYSIDKRKTNASEALRLNGGHMMRAFVTYVSSAALSALVESLVDAARDDDDYETFLQKVQQAFFGESGFLTGNLGQDLTILGKIPLVKDIINTVLGNSSSDMSVAAVEAITNSYNIWRETIQLANGTLEKPTKVTYNGNMTEWGKIYKTLQALSQLSGIAVSNLTRDAVAIWNVIQPDRKIKTYEPKTETSIKNSAVNGFLTPDQAYEEMIAADIEEDDAKKLRDQIRFIRAGKGFDSISGSAAHGYYEYAEEAGVDEQTYYDTWVAIKKMTGDDLNGDGTNDTYTKLDKQIAYIDTLDLTRAQKMALAYALTGSSEKTVRKRARFS